MAREDYSRRGSRDASIWEALTDFSYNPASAGSWVKLGCQVGVVAAAIVLIKATDGVTCGKGWSSWLPQTWPNPVGCFVRGLVKNVPDNFLDESATSQPANLVAPPTQPIAPPPRVP